MSGSEHARPARELDYRDQVRLVPMTGQQRDWIFKAASVLGAHEELGSIGNAWDAAPADPTEAIAKVLFADAFEERYTWAEIDDDTREAWLESARELLAPLGCAKDPA